MSEADIAWAAGIFEGEGSISFNRRRPRLQLQMTDEDIVRRFGEVVGLGKVSGPYTPPSRAIHKSFKPTFQWAVYRRSEVEAVLSMFHPWLGERRLARAHEVLKGDS